MAQSPFGDLPGMAAAELVEIRPEGAVLTVRFLSPVLGNREAGDLSKTIFRRLMEHEETTRVVVLDLSEVCGISSMGLGLCVELRNTVVNAGGKCVLFGLCPHLQDLVRMMKIERLYTIAHTARELANVAAV
jgi:anti-anti-sigma factor